MYREIFSHHFPSPSAKKTVPSQGKSIGESLFYFQILLLDGAQLKFGCHLLYHRAKKGF